MRLIVKIRYIVVIVIFMLVQNTVFGQIDTIPLSEVEISSSTTPVVFRHVSRSIRVITSAELASAPVFSLDDVLRYYGGLDVRERGPLGVQSDIGIRGGGMDQNLIMVNGVALNDPQTGHHNLSQAVMPMNIDKIEILEGPGSRWFGPNAFSGGINIITSQPHKNQLNIDLSGGQYGLLFADLSGTFTKRNWSSTTSFGRHKSDGYVRNTDFSLIQINNQTTYNFTDGLFRIYLGYLDKGFGANSFYTPKYPDQYEHIKNSLISLAFEKGKKLPIKTSLTWRRLYDRFELFREDNQWYTKQGEVYINGSDTAGFPTAAGIYPYKGHNYHRTDVVSMNAGIGFSTVGGSTNVGVSAKYEAIISNVLGVLMDDTIVAAHGDAWYNHRKERENITLYLNHSFIYGRFSVAGGLSGFYNSDYGLQFSPGIDLGYFMNDHMKVYATVNQAIRIPTFTDLYYQGPDQVSNPDLKPETATTYELGTKYFLNQLTISGAVFHREGKDLIDWIKTNPDEKWHSMNLTSMKTNGISFSLQYIDKQAAGHFLQSAGMSYTYLQSDKSSHQYLSLYALDYLNHNLVMNLTHHLFLKNLQASWAFNFQQRNGTYVDYTTGNIVHYQPVHRVNLRVNYQFSRVDVSITCQNLLNEKTVDYGNIAQPGIWLMAGLKARIDFPLFN